MKRLLFFVIISSALIFSQTISESLNYEPLEIGNKWIYRGYEYSIGLNDSISEIIEVLKDTILSDGNNYKKIIDILDSLTGIDTTIFYERIDSTTGRIYFYKSFWHQPYQFIDGEDLSLDTNGAKSPGSRFQQNSTSGAIDTIWLFGSERSSKLFYATSPDFDTYNYYNLTYGFGLTGYKYRYDFYNQEIMLKGCKIRGIVYGDTNYILAVNDLPETPSEFKLNQNYPNPFNPSTTISFSIPQRELVKFTIFDILGREAAVLFNEEQEPGSHTIQIDLSKFNLSSGTYFYRLSAGNNTRTMKMIYLK